MKNGIISVNNVISGEMLKMVSGGTDKDKQPAQAGPAKEGVKVTVQIPVTPNVTIMPNITVNPHNGNIRGAGADIYVNFR